MDIRDAVDVLAEALEYVGTMAEDSHVAARLAGEGEEALELVRGLVASAPVRRPDTPGDRLVVDALGAGLCGADLLGTLRADVSRAAGVPVVAGWSDNGEEDWLLPVYVEAEGDDTGSTYALCDLAAASWADQVEYLAADVRGGVAELAKRAGGEG